MQKAAIVILVLAVGVGGAMLFRRTPGDEIPASDTLIVREQEDSEHGTGAVSPNASKRQGVPLPVGGSPPASRKRDIADGNTAGQRPAIAEQNDALTRDGQPAPDGDAMRLPPAPPPSFGNSVRPPLPRLSEFEDQQRGGANPPPYSSRPPEESTATTANRDAPAAALPSSDEQETPELRQHMIVNGDTLERIARRYLGDSSRAGDVLDWNRDVLKDPNVLPLGCTIRIPPRRSEPRRLPRVTTAPVTEVGGNPTYDLVPLPPNAFSRDG